MVTEFLSFECPTLTTNPDGYLQLHTVSNADVGKKGTPPTWTKNLNFTTIICHTKFQFAKKNKTMKKIGNVSILCQNKIQNESKTAR